MHMVSKKDLDKAELATVRTSKKSNDGSYSQRVCPIGNRVQAWIG